MPPTCFHKPGVCMCGAPLKYARNVSASRVAGMITTFMDFFREMSPFGCRGTTSVLRLRSWTSSMMMMVL
jgi:hypothetical protein